MGDMRNAHNIFVGNHEDESPFARPVNRGED